MALAAMGVAIIRLVCPGCVDRSRANSGCEWTADTQFTVDVTNRAHWRHLVGDAQLAEELAVRYADVHFYRWAFPVRTAASGPMQTSDTHADNVRAQGTCLARLDLAIQGAHAVSPGQIATARAARSRFFDTMVLLVFSPLYLAAASTVCTRFHNLLFAHARSIRLIALALSSVSIGALGVICFALWQGIMEGIRVGNPGGHFGFRAAAHNYWSYQYVGALFAGGNVMFWIMVFFSHRLKLRASLGA